MTISTFTGISLVPGNLRSVTIGNLASGGAIGAASVVDNYDVAVLSQTTANMVLSNPTPTNTSITREFRWYNGGTVAVWTSNGRFVPVGSFADFLYVPGVGWKDDQLNRPQTIAQSGTPLTCPADTNENTLVTVNFPAGVIGATGRIVVYTNWSITASTNVKNVRHRLDGQLMGFNNTAGASNVVMVAETTIQNITASTQIATAYNGMSPSQTVAANSGTVNTALAKDLTITAQKATAGESIILLNYSVVLHRQA